MNVFDPAPPRLEDVTDPIWLSATLSRRWPDTRVEAVQIVEMLATQATKVRLALCFANNAAPQVPRHICIKGILTDTGAPRSASIVETLFYRDCASILPVNVPACIYAELNEAGDHGIVVMQDMVEAGANFCSALQPFSVDDTYQTVDQLARLHAATWQGSAPFDDTWVVRFLDQIGSRPIMPLEHLQQMLNGQKGARLPLAIKSAERLQSGIQLLAAQVRNQPSCLIHGDAHAGNYFRQDRPGSSTKFGLVDWQIFQTGEWAQDIAYHIAAVLTPEDRRTHERTILERYCESLHAHGGPALDRDEAWDRYRAAMLYGYFLWSITQKVEPEITNEFVYRLGTAIDELDSFSAVET